MKFKKCLFGLMCFFIISLVICMSLSMVWHNILLSKYSTQLYRIPLPLETKLVSQDKAIGNLYGTGNHLDFVATIEINSSLSEQELNEYYTNKITEIKSVEELSKFSINTTYSDMVINHTEQTIEVIPQKYAKPIYGDVKLYKRTSVPNEQVDSSAYIIQIKDTHYMSFWDIRCY